MTKLVGDWTVYSQKPLVEDLVNRTPTIGEITPLHEDKICDFVRVRNVGGDMVALRAEQGEPEIYQISLHKDADLTGIVCLTRTRFDPTGMQPLAFYGSMVGSNHDYIY